MGIEVTRIYTDPYVGDPMNHYKTNLLEWENVKLELKIASEVQFTQQNPLNMLSSNFLLNMDNSNWNHKGIEIGDILFIDYVSVVDGVQTPFATIRNVVDIQGALLEYDGVDITPPFRIMPAERSIDDGTGTFVDAEIKDVVVSVNKRPDGLDIVFGHLSNSAAASVDLNSYIDSTKTRFRVKGISTLIGTKTMDPIGRQSGMSIHSYDITYIGKIGAYTYVYEIDFKILNNSFFDVDISGIENNVYPDVLLNNNCLTDNFDIQAQKIARDPNVYVSNNNNITAILGNTGFDNESYNGGNDDFTVESFSYETIGGDPLTELSYGGATVVKATISGIQNLTVGSTIFSLGFAYLPKTDSEFKDLDTPFYKNALINTGGLNAGADTFLLIANGGGSDPAIRQGYSTDGITKMDVSHVKFEEDGANVLFEARFTPTVEFTNKFEDILPANRTYYIGVSCADHTLSTSESNRVMKRIDNGVMTLTETPLGAFGFTNNYIANYESKTDAGNAVANVFPQDNFASKLSFTIDLANNVSFSDMDFRIELVNSVTEDKFLLDSFIVDLSEQIKSNDGTQEFDTLDSRGFLIDDSTNDKNEVSIVRDETLDGGTVRGYAAYIGLKCRYEDWIENKNLPEDVFDINELNKGYNNFWFYLNSLADWDVKYVIETSAIADGVAGVYRDEYDLALQNYDSNTEFIPTVARYYRYLDNSLISDAILKAGEKVIFECDFELGASTFDDFANAYVGLQIEEEAGGGWKSGFQFSNIHKTQSNSPLLPLDGITFLQKTLLAPNKIQLKCLIDGDKLPVERYRISPEIKATFTPDPDKYINYNVVDEYQIIPNSRFDLGFIWQTLDFTISLYWKPINATNGILKPIMGNNFGLPFSYFGFWLFQGVSGGISFYSSRMALGLTMGGPAVATDDWHHIVVTCNNGGTDRGVYVNKIAGGVGTYGGTTAGVATEDVRFNNYGVVNMQQNNLDKIAFFNKGIDATEVTELFDEGQLRGDYSGLSFAANRVSIYEMDAMPTPDLLGNMSDSDGVNMDASNVKDL